MKNKKIFLSSLCSTCQNVTSSIDYPQALQSLVKNAVSCLGAKASSVRLLDKSGKILEIAATFGLSKAYLKKGPVEVAKSPLDKAVLTDKVIQIKDVTKDKRFQYPQEAKKEGIKSVLCLPLRCRERILGVLRIYTKNVRTFSKEEIEVVKTFATQGAAVLKNARRYKRLKSLSLIGKDITSQLDIQKVLDSICQNASADMSAKGATLLLINRETNQYEVVASFGLSQAFIRKGTVEADKSISECLEGKAVVIENAASDSRIQYPGAVKAEGIKSIICIPLKLKDRIVGTLRIYTAYKYKLSEEDLEFLNILADFGIVAIENARLYEHMKRDYDDLTRDVWKWFGWGERQPEI